MKISLVCSDAMPHFTGGGIGMTSWGILDSLLARGHAVQVIAPLSEEYKVRALRDRGAEVVQFITHRIPSPELPAQLGKAIDSFAPDVICAFPHTGLVLAAAADKAIPRVCTLGDLPHLVLPFRRQYVSRSIPMEYGEIAQLHNEAIMIKAQYVPLLKVCAVVGNFCFHHTAWLKAQGVNCIHTRMPILDSAFLGWRRRRADMPQNPKPRILLAGHLNGIATMSGLIFLAEDILPHLDVDKYDIHICGAEIRTPDLLTRFKMWPSIQWRGFVLDIRKEILQADIFLCPTPQTLGLRTRLIEVMSLGGCIVAHSANAVGMPEMVHEENALLNGGRGLAELIERAAWHPNMRYQLGHRARETYEKYFTPEKAGGIIVDMIESGAKLKRHHD